MNLDGCDDDFVETTPKDELPNLLELLLTEYEDGTSHRPVQSSKQLLALLRCLSFALAALCQLPKLVWRVP